MGSRRLIAGETRRECDAPISFIILARQNGGISIFCGESVTLRHPFPPCAPRGGETPPWCVGHRYGRLGGRYARPKSIAGPRSTRQFPQDNLRFVYRKSVWHFYFGGFPPFRAPGGGAHHSTPIGGRGPRPERRRESRLAQRLWNDLARLRIGARASRERNWPLEGKLAAPAMNGWLQWHFDEGLASALPRMIG